MIAGMIAPWKCSRNECYMGLLIIIIAGRATEMTAGRYHRKRIQVNWEREDYRMSKKIGIFAIVLALISIAVSLFTMGYCLKLFEFGNKTEETEESDVGMQKRTQYVMYVGTNDKDTYQIEMSEAEAKDIVDQICLKYMKGYTLDEATGSWVDEAGVRIHEYTLVCYFDDPEPEDVYSAADEILHALNQSSILIESNEISMEYYSGK